MSRPRSCSFCDKVTFDAGLLIQGRANIRASICRACVE
jgi:ClpX C4-type zinc finger